MIDLNTDGGRAMADAMVTIQAQIIAFSHDYQMVMLFIAVRDPARDHDQLDQGRAAQRSRRRRNMR